MIIRTIILARILYMYISRALDTVRCYILNKIWPTAYEKKKAANKYLRTHVT